MSLNQNLLTEKRIKEEFLVKLLDSIESMGLSVFRINDYGTLAVEVPYPTESDPYGVRVMELKFVWPRQSDGEGTPYSLDEGILAFEARVKKDKEKTKK